MGTPVYQPAHGFSRGDAVVFSGTSWAKTTGAWDAVVALRIDRDRFEVLTAGVLDGFSGLTVGASSAIGTAISPTAILLHPEAEAEEEEDDSIEAHASSHASGGSDAISASSIGAATSGHSHSGLYVLLPLAGGVLDIDYGELVFDIDTLEQVVEA